MNFNKEILEKGIVFLSPDEPFTWSSGIKSPIYCDNRLILNYPELRTYVYESLSELVQNNFKDVEVIMGTSTAGIPHGTLVANYMGLPCGYVRGDAKKHGRNNQIEGATIKGKKVVVIEDLISTGSSAKNVIDVLKANGGNVIGLVGIFSYNFKKANEVLQDTKFVTLSNINNLIKYAKDENLLSQENIEEIIDFISAR